MNTIEALYDAYVNAPSVDAKIETRNIIFDNCENVIRNAHYAGRLSRFYGESYNQHRGELFLGFTAALDSYDPACGTRLTTWIANKVRYYALEVERDKYKCREDSETRLDRDDRNFSLDEICEEDSLYNPSENCGLSAEDVEHLGRVVEILRPRFTLKENLYIDAYLEIAATGATRNEIAQYVQEKVEASSRQSVCNIRKQLCKKFAMLGLRSLQDALVQLVDHDFMERIPA